MAYTFQTRATADLIMLKSSAEHLLKLLGKTCGEPGIITVEQIPQALKVLEQAVDEDEKLRKKLQDQIQSSDAEISTQAARLSSELGSVSLKQRVVPFSDMLRRSAEEGKPVTWSL